MKLIKIKNSAKYGVVDDCDYDEVKKYSWAIYEGCGYPQAFVDGKVVKLHRFVAGSPPDGLITDHINRNPLDNRRDNLRFCTYQQNALNRGKRKNSKSKYKGVKWCSKTQTWIATIFLDGERKHYTNHETEREAALRYNKELPKHHGDYACLNIV